MKKKVSILGSTGSIGKQTLEVLQHLQDEFEVYGLAAGSKTELLEEQARVFKPRVVACGENAATALAGDPAADIVVLAISGFAALRPLLAAIPLGKRIAIANKESLVCGGHLVQNALAASGAELIPIDSEQSALFQCLQTVGANCVRPQRDVKQLILTASGGPFWRKNRDELRDITPAQALAHPTWTMGRKITLDSATLMNKGLEVIEAARLFHFDADQISVVIHPQSVIHALVEFADGSMMASLAQPDMRLPIQYALTYPNRLPSLTKALSLTEIGKLEFYPADETRFPSLRLAYEALRSGGGYPVVYNGANERAAELFFTGEISFLDIDRFVESALSRYVPQPMDSLEAIFEADRFARQCAMRNA
ncbi:MAG: 1-deoxy-D-xylulose-5-phosphate reductoisomerase [Clostridiales bacterium]|nr:1-deoxy-D-xylulose-5-phosphate reductoisomerase [Clostridiales bacterium]